MKNINRSKRKILLLYPRSSFRNILSEDHCHFQCIFCRSCKFRSSLVTDRYVYSRATDSISKHALIKRATLIGCRGHLKSGGHRCSESASSMISVPPWNVRQQTYIQNGEYQLKIQRVTEENPAISTRYCPTSVRDMLLIVFALYHQFHCAQDCLLIWR